MIFEYGGVGEMVPLGGKLSSTRKIFATLSISDLTWTGLGLNPSVPGENIASVMYA